MAQLPLTYAQYNPTSYAKKCANFAERIDIANDWLTHICMVQIHCNYSSDVAGGVDDAIKHLHGLIAAFNDFIEIMNEPIK